MSSSESGAERHGRAFLRAFEAKFPLQREKNRENAIFQQRSPATAPSEQCNRCAGPIADHFAPRRSRQSSSCACILREKRHFRSDAERRDRAIPLLFKVKFPLQLEKSRKKAIFQQRPLQIVLKRGGNDCADEVLLTSQGGTSGTVPEVSLGLGPRREAARQGLGSGWWAMRSSTECCFSVVMGG